MGLMDKIKDKTKDISGSAMIAMDKSKLDSKIREEQKKIDSFKTEIGSIAVEAFRNDSEPDESAMRAVYEKIIESEKVIADLESQKEGLSEKYQQEKILRDKERTAKELEDAQVKAAEAAAKAENLEKKE